jgi:FMN phosphatase YigB (HAD superfamily)
VADPDLGRQRRSAGGGGLGHPAIDACGWPGQGIVRAHSGRDDLRALPNRIAIDFTRALPAEKPKQLPLFLAETYRAASRFRLQAYPGVEETVRQLHGRYRLAAISDG